MRTFIIIIGLFIADISLFSQAMETLYDSRDGKTYKTVKIGTQIWMAENLAYKVKGGCRAYKNKKKNASKYGYLYQWSVAQYVCPSGWRLPSSYDFELLLNYVDSTSENAYKSLLENESSGFSSRFGGYRSNYVGFFNIGKSACYWSSSEGNDIFATSFTIEIQDNAVGLVASNRFCAYSVRCIKKN